MKHLKVQMIGQLFYWQPFKVLEFRGGLLIGAEVLSLSFF